MGRKIFVSYKHNDKNIYKLEEENYKVDGEYTARSYVDYLIDSFKGDEIYKGEGNEDLSKFKDDTIKNHLKEKIHDSSITLVLISPKMKTNEKESGQWVPWEIAYSLKEITRNDRTSHPNGIIALVLPDKTNSYSYYIEDNTCQYCNCRTLKTNELFKILKENMFNIKEPTFSNCEHHTENTVYTGESSYILSVKWHDFIKDKDQFIERATAIRDNRKAYNIVKEIQQ